MPTTLTLARIIKKYERDHRPPIIFRDGIHVYCYAGGLAIQDDPALARLAEREQLLALEPVPVVHPVTMHNRKLLFGQSRTESLGFENRVREEFSTNQERFLASSTPGADIGYNEPMHYVEVGLEDSKRAGALGVVAFAKLFDYAQQTTGGQPYLGENFDRIYFIEGGKVRALLDASVAYRSREDLKQLGKGLTAEQKEELEQITQQLPKK